VESEESRMKNLWSDEYKSCKDAANDKAGEQTEVQ